MPKIYIKDKIDDTTGWFDHEYVAGHMRFCSFERSVYRNIREHNRDIVITVEFFPSDKEE